jgi:hypothetical protein
MKRIDILILALGEGGGGFIEDQDPHVRQAQDPEVVSCQ